MLVPRYWAKVVVDADSPEPPVFPLAVWRASPHSLAEAEQQARAAVGRLAKRHHAGEPLPHGYGYPGRPLREELLKEINDADGDLLAIVTRNGYGAIVLNTASLMFIDVDLPHETLGAGLRRGVRRLFGRATPSLASVTRDRITAWIAARPELAGRLYETAAGFRLLITTRLFSPTSDESQELLASVGADPLYVRLCEAQGCYRARLTPKAWRCGLAEPPVIFPFETLEHETRFRCWEVAYDAARAGFATCRLVEIFGHAEPLPQALPLIELHDGLTRARETLPLA